MMVTGLAAGALVLKPRKVKAIPPCGPICAILVTVIVLGVLLYILVKTLKGCEKLKKDYQRTHPDDDEDTVTPVTLPPNAKIIQSDPSQPLAQAGQSADISDLGYTDPNGNTYCTVSETHFESTDLAGNKQAEGHVETYVSFPSATAMVWNDQANCYASIMNGSQRPAGVRIKTFDKNGALVGSQYQSFTAGNAHANQVTISGMSDTQLKLLLLRTYSPTE